MSGKWVGDEEFDVDSLDESTIPGLPPEQARPGEANDDVLALLDAVAGAAPPTAPAAPAAAAAPTSATPAVGRVAGSIAAAKRVAQVESTRKDLEDAMAEALAAVEGRAPHEPEEATEVDLDAAMRDAMAAMEPARAPQPDEAPHTSTAAAEGDDFGLFESMPEPFRREEPASPPAAEPERDASTADAGATPRLEPTDADAADSDSASDVERSEADQTQIEEAELRQSERVGVLLREFGKLIGASSGGRTPQDLLGAAAKSVLQAVVALEPPFALHWTGPAVRCDDAWVPLDPDAHAAAIEIGQALAKLGIAGMDFRAAPGLTTVLGWARALAAATQPADDDGLRAVPRSQPRGAEERAHAALLRLVALGDRLLDDPATWPIDAVTAALSSIELALAARQGGVLRALWLDEPQFETGRAAAEVAILALLGCGAIGVGTTTRRALAHAAFALALTGTQEQPPPPLADAASLAATRLERALHGGALDPHGLRVAALLGAASRGDDGQRNGPLALLGLLHRLVRLRLETRRQAAVVDLVNEAADRGGAAWAGALVASVGGLPIGTPVALGPDRRGVVVEARGAALLVDLGQGKVEQVEQAVPFSSRRH